MSKTIIDIQNLADNELISAKKEARQEIFNLRLQQQTGRLEKPSRLKELKREIAKIETVSSQRRLGIKAESKKTAKKA